MTAPIGYLIPAVIISLGVYFVLVPRNWSKRFGTLGAYLAVTNEVPFVALFWLAAVTGLAISERDIYSPVGWTATALSILAAAGLLVIIFRATRARGVIIRALAKDLGAQWSEDIDPRMMSRLLLKRITLHSMLGPISVRRMGVRHIKNLPYGDAGKYNTLDVYHRKRLPKSAPIFIHIHGGALISGRKDHDALPLLYQLASNGWVCISANYRLDPGVTFHEQVRDIKKVITWAKDHGRRYGADTTSVFLAGGSSGAQLAAVAALTADDPSLQPRSGHHADTTISAAISLYGNFVYGPADQLPFAYIHKDAPSFFILHGDRDTMLPVAGSQNFAEKLRDVSTSPVVYAELPGAEHNFDQFNSIHGEIVATAIEAFAMWVRARS